MASSIGSWTWSYHSGTYDRTVLALSDGEMKVRCCQSAPKVGAGIDPWRMPCECLIYAVTVGICRGISGGQGHPRTVKKGTSTNPVLTVGSVA